MNNIECQLHYAESRREGWDHWEAVRFLLDEFNREQERCRRDNA